MNLLEIVKNIEVKYTKGKLDLEFKGISTDTRRLSEGEIFLAIKGKNFDGHDFLKEAEEKGAKAVIVEKIPEVNLKIPILLVNNTVNTLGEIAKYYRNKFSIPLIAISGSNGKTTTKDMLAYLLGLRYKVLKNEGTQNNQIGVPLTLLKLNEEYEIAVLELGTNHFGEIEYLTKISRPNIGIILNIAPAHLEFFKTLKGVFREKINLIKGLYFPYIGILNNDDVFLNKYLKKTKKKFLLSFGIKRNADFKAENIKLEKNRTTFFINKREFSLNTLGTFNVYNALASISVCRLFGFNYQILSKALREFAFPSQRLNLINRNGILFIDDTYNSNPNSLNQALNVLKDFKIQGRKIAVLGDMLELGDNALDFHFKLSRKILEICDIIIGVGNFFGKFKDLVKANSLKKPIFNSDNSSQAKEILFKEVKPKRGDLILVKGSRLLEMEKILR